MTDKMFDQFVRDKLSDHESPVPAGLWEKIADKREKNRKPFVLPRMFWIALVWILAGLGGGYLIYQRTTIDKISKIDDDKQVNTIPAGSGKLDKTDLSDRKDDSGSDVKGSTDNEKGDLNDANDDSKGNIVSKDEADRKNGLNDGGDLMQRNNVPDNSNTGNVGKDAVAKRSTTSKVRNNTGNDNLVPNDNGIANSNPKQKTSTTTKANGQPSIINDPLQTADANTEAYTPFIAGSVFSLKNLSALENKHRKLGDIRLSSVDCPPNGVLGRNDLYLEVYGSPDHTMKSTKASGAANSFLNKKDSTETQTGGFTAGFRLSKAFSNNMMLKAGLQYSQLNERFDLRTENERKQITVITTRTVIRGPGDTLIISDTSVQDIVGYRVKRTYNTYRNIEIPVLIGYEFGGEKWRYGINAGVIVNLKSWYSGEALDTSFMAASLSSKSVGMKKSSVGLGLYAGFSVIKPIGNKIDVFAEPYFRYNLSQMESSAGYKQRFSAAGLNIGIRYRLKGRGTGNADK